MKDPKDQEGIIIDMTQEFITLMMTMKKKPNGVANLLKIGQNVAKPFLPYVKLPSFSGDSDPNLYLGWEAKVEQIFNVHEVQDDQKVKLASLEFLDYAMQW